MRPNADSLWTAIDVLKAYEPADLALGHRDFQLPDDPEEAVHAQKLLDVIAWLEREAEKQEDRERSRNLDKVVRETLKEMGKDSPANRAKMREHFKKKGF